jgi:hypothetical protein
VTLWNFFFISCPARDIVERELSTPLPPVRESVEPSSNASSRREGFPHSYTGHATARGHDVLSAFE